MAMTKAFGFPKTMLLNKLNWRWAKKNGATKTIGARNAEAKRWNNYLVFIDQLTFVQFGKRKAGGVTTAQQI